MRLHYLSVGFMLSLAGCTPTPASPATGAPAPATLCLGVAWYAESAGVRMARPPTFRVDSAAGRLLHTDTIALLRIPPDRPPWRPGEYFAARPVPEEGLRPYAFWRWEEDSLTLYRGGGWFSERWRLAVIGDSVHGWDWYATDDGGYWLLRGVGSQFPCSSTGPGAT